MNQKFYSGWEKIGEIVAVSTSKESRCPGQIFLTTSPGNPRILWPYEPTTILLGLKLSNDLHLQEGHNGFLNSELCAEA